ncbi:unnamed protein product, partial [Tetraodon nigroviridis]
IMSAKHVKPDFSKSQAADITRRLFGFTPIEMGSLPSYMDQNFYVATAEGGKYVLKVFNLKDSENPSLIEAQMWAMSFLLQNGIPVPTSVPTASGQITSLEEAGLIHGDFNDLNVLVQPDDDGHHRISGILDFGDMHVSYYIYELAIVILYMMLEQPNPVEVGGPVLAGWESVLPLNEAEKECLYTLVISRLCQSLILARHSVMLHPDNEEYLMLTSKKGVPLLHLLWELGKEAVEKVWFDRAAQYSDEK